MSKCLVLPVCFLTAIDGCLNPPPPAPVEEFFVALPDSLTLAGYPAVIAEVEAKISVAPDGTPFTFFHSKTQELIATYVVPGGSKAYRVSLAEEALAAVYERLDPELAGGDQTVRLISLPASVRKYRKRPDLKPTLIVCGSPMVEDPEGHLTLTPKVIACDGCVNNPESSYAGMERFPAGTTVRWFSPTASYGNGPNYRRQVEGHLRFAIQERDGRLLILSSDAEVVFRATKSQWDEEQVEAADDCRGMKEVAIDNPEPVLYTPDGGSELHRNGEITVTVRNAEVRLEDEHPRWVLFLIDMSGSVVVDSAGNDRSYLFVAIKRDMAERVTTMPFAGFAVTAFGGYRDASPRIENYPTTLLGAPVWSDATGPQRTKALRFLESLVAGGGTPTLAALHEVERLSNEPLTCFLYTDGIPTLGEGGMTAVLDYAKELSKRGVVINTVGVGALSAESDQFDWTGGDFLSRLAAVTGGAYYALDTAAN